MTTYGKKASALKKGLERVIYSPAPRNNELRAEYARKKKAARRYLAELEEFERCLPEKSEVVGPKRFDKICQEADDMQLEQGEFITVATVHTFPELTCHVYVTLATIKSL